MYYISEEVSECGGFGKNKDETRMLLCYTVTDSHGSGISLRDNKKLAEATMTALNKGQVYLTKSSSEREGITLLPTAKFIMGKYAKKDLRALGYKV